jgi:hypothetical protein
MASWMKAPGGASARWVGAGADGSIWHIGQDFKLYTWVSWGVWARGPDAGFSALVVTADKTGQPWIMGGPGSQIYRWTGSSWSPAGAGAQALDIASGGDAIWHIGMNNNLYRWNEARADWDKDGNAASVTSLTVQSDGTPWHVGNGGIYHLEGGTWVQHGGPCDRLAASGKLAGVLYQEKDVPDYGHSAYWRWNGSDWHSQIPYLSGEMPTRIAVDGSGTLWALSGTDLWIYL